MSTNLKNLILLVGAAGVAVFAALMTYEFIELIINLAYTCLLMIVLAFFYQNKSNALLIVNFLFDLQLGDSPQVNSTTQTKDVGSPLGSPSSDLPSVVVGQHRVGGVISTETNAVIGSSSSEVPSALDNKQKRKSDKEIVAQLYEQIKELNLQFFTERINSDKEKLAIQQRLKAAEAAATDSKQEYAKWKVAAEQQKAKSNELIKERDTLMSSESRLSSKLHDYERKEKNWNDNEKALVKKVSEFKDTISQQKKEIDERTKRIAKLEDQVAKLQKQQVNGIQMREIASSTDSSSSSASSKPVVVETKQVQEQSAFQMLQISPGSSPNGGIQLPPPTIVTTTTTLQQQTTMTATISQSSSNSNNNLLGARDSSEDEDSSSSSSVSSSPSGEGPKQLKNLFKKVKSGSTKIIFKAQNHLNKQFHTDFFTPPTPGTSASPNKDRSDAERDIFDTPSKDNVIPKERKVMFDANVEKELFGSNGADIFKFSPTNGADLTKNIPDIFTFEEECEVKPGNDLSDLLSQLGPDMKFNFNDSTGTGYINSRGNRSSVSSDDSLFSCIKEFSIKESENKAGLRRAKKKPLSPNASMMEDVSFGQFPFNNNNETALFGVFDGHAGRDAAQMASTLVPEEFKRLINSKSDYLEKADMTDLFLAVFETVDNKMKEDCQYVGCTATVSFIWTYNGSRYLQVANVGDSSSFLCRNGVAVEMTFDHKASHPLEKKRMVESGIPVGEQQTRINGVAVSRSLGNHFIKDQNIGMIAIPHISKAVLLQDTDAFLIMASDGLWDVVNGQQAIDVGQELVETRGAQSVSSNLLQSALQMNDCKDNVTILTVKIC